MPLTQCPDCKKEVSSIAEFCPHCGRSSQKRQTVNADLGVWQGVKIGLGMVVVLPFLIGIVFLVIHFGWIFIEQWQKYHPSGF